MERQVKNEGRSDSEYGRSITPKAKEMKINLADVDGYVGKIN